VAKAGLGCCQGFVHAALLGPVVGLAVGGAGKRTLAPAAQAALAPLIAAVNSTGGGAPAALLVDFARALSSSCGLSLAPCTAKSPSSLTSRAAGINFAWATATPERAAAFSAAFTADLAAALFVPARMLNVTSLAPGSVIITTQAGGASSKFSSDLVKSAALVLNSPAFAFTSVLTLIEPDRANALSGVLAGAGGSGSASAGGTIGGATDLNVTAPSTTTSSVAAAAPDASSASGADESADIAATATNVVIGAVVGVAALMGIAFVIRVRSRRPAPRSGVFAASASEETVRQTGEVVAGENSFRAPPPPPAGPLVIGTPRLQRAVFAPTPGL